MAKTKKSNKDLLVRIRERYKAMSEGDQDNRRKAMEDMKFALVPGEQWDLTQKKERGARPCYEFNKIRVTGKRIVNDMRANRPQGKVRAVEDGDKGAAEALEGLARNIWHVSDGDTVIDYAGEYQVFGGMGAWRVVVDYADDDAFEQDIRVEALRNPFCLYSDPAASDPIKRDAMDWILTERISKSEYERRWPKADVIEFESSEFDDDEWDSDDRVRICEYWYKEAVTRRILLLSDGRTIREDELTPEKVQAMTEAGLTVVKDRETQSYDVYMCIASGEAILEGPTKFVGKEFPFIVVYGEWVVIDGKPHWCGITRFAKDAQRNYNVARTAISETIASAPQAKYMLTPEQINGLDKSWADAHKENFPYLLYNADPKAPGPPVRMGGAEVPVALIQESQLASEEIKAVTGIFDASLGKQSNETTGIAIRARQAQGEIATFNFADNMAKGIRRTWEILIDLIPKIYDTQRTVRVLGVDGAEKYLTINGQDPNTGDIRDITRGKYDAAVTTGPGFSTQREAATEYYTQLVGAHPEVLQLIGDLVFKSMDLPYSDKIAERFKTMLPPQIQQMESEGKPIPPEAQAVMMQAQQAMAMAEQQSQLVQQAAQEVEQGKAEADKAKSEVQMAISDLEVKRAQFEGQVAKQMAALTVKEAQMAQAQGETESTNDRESLSLEVQTAVTEIQKLAAQFMQQANQTMAEIQRQNVTQVVVPPKPRIVGIKKQPGGMMVPIYEDQVAQ